MGRKKSPDLAERTARIIARVRPGYLRYVKDMAKAAGDESVVELVERLVVREAKRLKMPPPPPR